MFVHGIKIKVCQEFLLNTLNISKNRVCYFFKNVQDPATNIPRSSSRGKYKKKIISDKEQVRDHISSFSLIESHYCRANSSKKYLERDLSIQKMHDLYKVFVEKLVNFIYTSPFLLRNITSGFLSQKRTCATKCQSLKLIKAQLQKKEWNMKNILIEKIGETRTITG